ncbi:DUF2171 domain-containing protein [Sphingomonas beigongshangi]|jgi:hypothetical protein|uniref:DUF2171 domain-containing protein n=1 Tax=Sphingomonas beigongshangi TaxID=2782540 RepID=UPI001AEE71F2|nr:DUF2171 domain-containing protein [Sphingomonas beigongshangi]
MGYERYPRGTNPQGDYYGRSDTQDYGHDYGSGRSYSYSSARDYEASGAYDNDRDYGRREYGNQRYEQRDRFNRDRDAQGGRGYGRDDAYGRSDAYGRGSRDDSYGRGSRDWGQSDNRFAQQNRYGADQDRYGARQDYHGSYGHDGRRFLDVGQNRHADDDNYRGRYDNRGSYGEGRSAGRPSSQQGGYGRQPQGYDYDERGFFARAGDEVRSWFGDEDAERRREMDSRYDERHANDREDDYGNWRRGQIASLDRDYDEYRRENRTKFENEFSSWRTNRQGQRDSLNKVEEHMDVVGSDGEHVGTVDKVRGDRILLTKNDRDAGGHHHSIPSSWLKTVDGKVTLSKTAAEAKQAWRDEERNQAMFGYGDNTQDGGQRDATNTRTDRTTTPSATGSQSTAGQATSGQSTTGQADAETSTDGKNLNRSFPGTY